MTVIINWLLADDVLTLPEDNVYVTLRTWQSTQKL